MSFNYYPSSYRSLEASLSTSASRSIAGPIVFSLDRNKPVTPHYNMVTAWRMIHLLPVMAKVVEPLVLLVVTKHVDLEEKQFRGGRKRGVHHALGVV